MRALAPSAVFLSAATGEGLDELKERLSCQISGDAGILNLEIPPDRAELVALLHRKGRILSGEYRENGSFCGIARVPGSLIHAFREFCTDLQDSFSQEETSFPAEKVNEMIRRFNP